MASNSRKVLDYSDLSKEASTSTLQLEGRKDVTKPKGQDASSSSSSKVVSWSEDGTPRTASSARKLRKVLNMISTGKIEAVEKELDTMEMARNNLEIQTALTLAKTRRAEGTSQDRDKGIVAEEVIEYGADWDGEGECDTDMVENSFDWQGNMHDDGKEGGRQLTHAEIWDDSALVDAWNAAEEEYQLFHARRSAQENGNKRKGQAAEAARPPQKRSALWHESPDKGSPAARAAKAALEDESRNRKELERRKKEAKALLARLAGDEQNKPNDDNDQESIMVEEHPSNYEREKPSEKRPKGTTPPSSGLSGNLAWHSACATVSKTPNAIGRVKEDTSTSTEKTTHIPTAAPYEASLPTSDEGQEIFQNLAMAWYYAGYYQAMATSWSAGREAKN
ncbi:hypothetical protein CBS101457_001768 [Exobasidium rhododendri]|nr:hypothetical protein CBS101457_001768 [Exobasidium rhododendri]